MTRSSPMLLVRLVLCVSTTVQVCAERRDDASIFATSATSLAHNTLDQKSQSWQSYVRRRRMNTNYRRECLPILDESDRDSNGVVDQTEFLGFAQRLGLPLSFRTLPLVLQSKYNFLACQCVEYGGTDDCCLGSAAGINVQQVTESDLYLHDVCYFTSRGIAAALLDEVTASPTVTVAASPTPAPIIQQSLAPSVILPSQVPTATDENSVGGSSGSDIESTDSISSGAIASLVVVGAVVFALLTALLASGKCAPGQYKKKPLPDFHDSPFDDSEISYEEDDESYRYDTEVPLKGEAGSLLTPLKRKSSLDPPPGEYQHYDAYQEELEARYNVQLGQRVDTDSTYSETTSDESPTSQKQNIRKIMTDQSGVVIHTDTSKRAPLAPGEQDVYGATKLMSYEASNIRSSESLSSSEQDSVLLFNSAAPVAVGVTMAGGMAAVASRNRSRGEDTDDSSLSMTNQLEEQFLASGMELESSDDAQDVLTQQAIQSNSRRSINSQRQSDRELALAQASPDVVEKAGLQHVVDQRGLQELRIGDSSSSPSQDEKSSEGGEAIQSNSKILVDSQRQSDPGLQHVVDQRAIRQARTGESSSPSESETSSESDAHSSSDSSSVSGNSQSDNWSTSTSSSSSSSSTEDEAITITNYDPRIAMGEIAAFETGMQVARVSSNRGDSMLNKMVVGTRSNSRNDLEDESGAFSKRSSISGEESGSPPSSSYSSSREFVSRDGISELPSFEGVGREQSLRSNMMESSQPSLSDMSLSRPTMKMPPDDSCSDLINSRPWSPAEEVLGDSPLRARAILSGTIDDGKCAPLPNLDPIVSEDDMPFSTESEDESSSQQSGMSDGDGSADIDFDESTGKSGAFDSYKQTEPEFEAATLNGSHPPANEAAEDAAEWAIARSLAMLKDSDNTNVTIAGDPLSSSGGGYSTSRSDFDRGDLEESSV